MTVTTPDAPEGVPPLWRPGENITSKRDIRDFVDDLHDYLNDEVHKPVGRETTRKMIAYTLLRAIGHAHQMREMEIVRLSDVEDTDLLRWVFDLHVPSSACLILGFPGEGKGWLECDLITSITSPTDNRVTSEWLGSVANVEGDVLIMETVDRAVAWIDRLRSDARGKGLDPEQVLKRVYFAKFIPGPGETLEQAMPKLLPYAMRSTPK